MASESKARAILSRYANVAGLFLAWLIIFFFFCWQVPNFASPVNLQTLARQATIVSLASLGMTYVIVSGGIDLSVGSILALVTVVTALFLKSGHSPVLSAALGIATGTACGLINGVLITRLKVGAFIVTLGTLSIFRGLAKWGANNQTINTPETWLNNLLRVLDPSEKWMLFPEGVWLAIVFAFLMALVLRSTRFGRNVLAVGGNEQAARYSGIGVEKVRLQVYMLMGFLTGIAGVLLFSRLTQGNPTAAVGQELDVIAAVVIGGASLSGGQGSILGTIIGVMIMGTIRAGCSGMGLSNYVQDIVTGSIIVIAVGLDRLRARGSG